MAAPVGDANWRATTPDAIEADLAALWRELAGRARPVARAVMSNLIVVRDQTVAPSQTISRSDRYTLDEVSAHHPSRVIVITHDEGRECAGGPLAARVGVLTFGPPEARYGVEQIAVQSGCAEAALPSIVRRLVRGDVPTSLWWRADLSRVPIVDALVAMGRQFIYDSRQWQDVRGGVLAVAPLLADRTLDIADVNWTRLTPVRQALLHAAGDLTIDDLCSAEVAVTHRPGDAAIAWLFQGWLSARMEWRRPAEASTVNESPSAAEDALVIAIRCERGAITVRLSDHRVVVEQDKGAPFSMGVPRQGEADAVAEELRSLARDVCLHDAIGALALHFSAA
ncbi:MAG TPA: glucose-6-phosphate dehydrogenase assembly protein OpcA [Vicinamibacterales bacterium]|nr:glucose-6-phosphate dehydrogenase assembly protein OpcA [Vicinamibacterales bacterium]